MTPQEKRRINQAIVNDSAKLQLLADKPHLSPQERRQYETLMLRISSLKSGFGLEETLQAEFNAHERAEGLEETRFERSSLTVEQRSHARAWAQFVQSGRVELRDETIGSVKESYFNGNLGSFVPVEFLAEVFGAMKWFDPLFDKDVVSYVETKHGRPIQVGTYGDIENVATVVGEASDQSANETDISKPGAVMLGAYSFRSPLWRVSLETFQDLEASYTAIGLFRAFASDRIARGVGRYLVNGSGVNQPLGLVNSLVATGVLPTTAVGSSGNTGGSESGATSIGSADIGTLYYSVNEAYRSSPKCAFLMNDSTLGYLASLVTKMGLPLVNFEGSQAYILGKRVQVSPSMDNIGPSKIPVLFGDLSYHITRCSIDPLTRIMLLKEVPGLIERGECALRMFARYDSALAYNDTNSPAPIQFIQNHS